MKPPRPLLTRVFLVAVILLVVVTYFYEVPNNPVGFFVDEASIAYNAYKIAQQGTDEYGEPFPLYFRAFGEYKSPVYIYLLSAVFWFTGPSVLVARVFSAVVGLIAAALLGLLGAQIAGRRIAGFLIFLFAALTPWFFEISRLVFEVALIPALLTLFLLVLYRASQHEKWAWPTAFLLGVLLGLMFYTYSAARLLAPLFALGLTVLITRKRWKGIVLTWVVFGMILLPLAVFTLRHPGALSERYKYVTYIKPEDTRTQIVVRFIQNYAGNFSPRSWLLKGDPEPRHHLPGMGSLLIGVVALAGLGTILVLRRYRGDGWWRFVLYGLVVSAIPAALTLDHFHTLRLIALPVFLTILTLPAIEFLSAQDITWPKTRHAILVALILLALAQGAVFQWRFHAAMPREDAFDSYYQELLATALARPERPIYLLDKTPAAYVYAFWYATLRGLDVGNFRRVTSNEPPPAGAVVISHETPCTKCEILKERGQFRVYVVNK